MIKISINKLTKFYTKDNKKYKVLEDINFNVFNGEILCIVGPSGCGKSTLLRQISGFEKPDMGQIIVDGKVITKPDIDRMLIFQDFNQLFPWKTVKENVIFPLKINKICSSEECEQRVKKYLDMVQLNDFNNSYPHQLSGGMKQKVAIARALALNPKVILMDEPFSSLDAITRKSFQDMLLEIRKKTKVTIIFVTHDIQEAIVISDRIIVMGKEPGKIKEIICNKVDKPRIITNSQYSELFNQIYSLIENL